MRWTLVALLSLLVATCGQKGPLSLPDEEAAALAPCVHGVLSDRALSDGVVPAATFPAASRRSRCDAEH